MSSPWTYGHFHRRRWTRFFDDGLDFQLPRIPAERAQYDRQRAEPTGATSLRLLTVMMRPVYGFFVFGIAITFAFGADVQAERCPLVFDLNGDFRLSCDIEHLLP